MHGHLGEQVHSGASYLRYGQVYSQVKQEKHFHPGNAATGQRDSAGLPVGRMCFSSFHSTSAEHRE